MCATCSKSGASCGYRVLDETAELHSKRMRLTVHWLGGDWVMDAEAVARGGRAGGLPPAKKMDLRVESAATVADLIVKVKGEVRVCRVFCGCGCGRRCRSRCGCDCLRVWRLSPLCVCVVPQLSMPDALRMRVYSKNLQPDQGCIDTVFDAADSLKSVGRLQHRTYGASNVMVFMEVRGVCGTRVC